VTLRVASERSSLVMGNGKVTWCRQCREFTAGGGPCPVCGYSRRGFETVTRITTDWRANWAGDGHEVPHSLNLARNR
jgi:hypothetical protein